MEKLTHEQIDFILQQFWQWHSIASKAGYNTGIDPVLANIDHSSLLRRLLAQEIVTDKAPPRSFSYPWTKLIEDGYSNQAEVHVWSYFPNEVIINQARWKLIATIAKDDGSFGGYIAEWPNSGLRVRCILLEDATHPFFKYRVEVINV